MGAEIREIISGTIEFSGLERERVITLDAQRLRELVDIRLRFYSGPAVAPLLRGMSLSGGEDYRVYINTYDVTEQVLDEIREGIAGIPSIEIERGYLKGAEAYLRLSEQLNYDQRRMETDKHHIQATIAAGDWNEEFEKLGDRTKGWSGNLHCFNYLYKHIPIESISISTVWEKYQQENGSSPTLLSEESSLAIVISQGPAPFVESFDARAFIPSGRVEFTLETLHMNPLEPVLRQIASNLRGVEIKLEQQRVNYLTPIKGAVELAQKDIELGNIDSEQALKKLLEAVRNL